MRVARFLTFVALVAIIGFNGASGTCVTFGDSFTPSVLCEAHGEEECDDSYPDPSVCHEFLFEDSQVYMADGVTAVMLETQAYQYMAAFDTLANVPLFIDHDCYISYKKYLCGNIYQNCSNAMCSSVCEAAVSDCAVYDEGQQIDLWSVSAITGLEAPNCTIYGDDDNCITYDDVEVSAPYTEEEVAGCYAYTLTQQELCVIQGGDTSGDDCTNPQQEYTPSCADVVDYLVYAPVNYTIAHLEAAAFSGRQMFDFYVDHGFFMDADCYDAAVRLSCASAFTPCTTVPAGGGFEIPVAVGRPPCRELCDSYTEGCSVYDAGKGPVSDYALLAVSPSANINCSAESSFLPGVPAFPPSDEPFLTDPIPVYCHEGSDADLFAEERAMSEPCPYPFARNHETNACGWQCPYPLYTDDEYDTLATVELYASLFSTIVMTPLVILWALFPHKRSFPSLLVFNLAISVLMIGASFFIMTVRGWVQTNCESDVHIAVQDSLAGFLGGVVLFFGLAAFYWWMLMTFNLYLVVARGKYTHQLKNLSHISLSIGWGCPLLTVIVVAACNRLGYNRLGVLPLINETFGRGGGLTYEDDYSYFSTHLVDIIWYYHTSVLTGIGLVFLIGVVWSTHKVVRNVVGSRSAVHRVRRLVVFSILILCTNAYICSFKFSFFNDDLNARWEKALSDFAGCVFAGRTDCKVEDRPPVGMWYLLAAVLSGGPAACFFACFGFTRDTRSLLAEMFGRTEDQSRMVRWARGIRLSRLGSLMNVSGKDFELEEYGAEADEFTLPPLRMQFHQ